MRRARRVMRRSREVVVVGATGGEDAAALHALMIFLNTCMA